eukprot:243328_1
MSTEKMAKRGPGTDQFAEAGSERDTTAFMATLYQRFCARGGFGIEVSSANTGASSYLVMSKTVTSSASNQTGSSQKTVHWRVSIGSSSRRKAVGYNPNSNVCTHFFSWGKYGSRANSVSALSACMQGTREIGGAGPAAHYNASELNIACGTIVDNVKFEQ